MSGQNPGDETGVPPTDRESPVGEPVIRGNQEVTGQRAADAVAFDPEDPESVEQAADTVRAFAGEESEGSDPLYMLRGAAACAALVRAEGSYKSAVARAGGDTTVPFVRKWARVHDLPRAIRRHVAIGEIAPTAAKHIARVSGPARYDLAWAVLDGGLTVREVRAIASAVSDGESVEAALRNHGVTPGALGVELPLGVYRELRRRAALDGVDPDEIVTAALEDALDVE
ncbi:MAG: hypothetical protein ABEJ08_06055 [Halobacteriaceae archaeon]